MIFSARPSNLRRRSRLSRIALWHALALGVAAAVLAIWLAVPPAVDAHRAVQVGAAAPPPPSAVPDRRPYEARDGSILHYRLYPAAADTTLVLVHGSGGDGRSLHRIASAIAQQRAASVVVPDLRGHGPAPARRGDVDYIGQLEDDVTDLFRHLRSRAPSSRLVLGGHSLGGGLALRHAGSTREPADAYLLLAPFLGHDAPTSRRNAGGWAAPHVGRIVVLSVLTYAGITRFNDAKAIAYNLPAGAVADHGTPLYSFRLLTSYSPADYRSDLRSISQPMLVLVGSADQSFVAQAFEPTIRTYSEGTVRVLDGIDHVGIVLADAAIDAVADWLRELPRSGRD